MFYIMSFDEEQSGPNVIYTMYDLITCAVIKVNKSKLKEMLNCTSITIKNARLENDEIILNKWFFDLLDNERYILLSKHKKHFKLLSCDAQLKEIDIHKFSEYVRNERVANCIIVDGKHNYIDITKEKANTELKSRVDYEYSKFMAKSKMMGQDLKFRYEIRYNEVVLKYYDGESKQVVIPNFITAIGSYAFEDDRIESIKLNKGIKYIGKYAFDYCKLLKIEIPETAVFMCETAVYNNKHLIGKHGELNYNNVIMSKNTLLL